MAQREYAFPIAWNEMDSASYGMTLRDYIAAQCLAAVIVARGEDVANPADMVENAFHFADLMLERRKKS